MARIDCTRILVAAPGLRPTAVEAAPPIKPTPMAAPRAARPTWILPIMASCLSLPESRASSRVRGRGRFFFVLTDEQRENGGQQHEHQGLHEAHEQLHEVERDGEQ